MKSINLLPRKPWSQTWFIPLIAVIIFFSLGGGVLSLYVMARTDSSIAKLKATISQNGERVHQLVAERQTDDLTQMFNTFSQQIATLKEARPYWVSIMDMLSTSLPVEGRIVSVNASEDGKLTIALEFGSIPDIAEYLITLRQNKQVDTVNVTTLSRTVQTGSGKAGTQATAKAIVNGAVVAPAPTPKATTSISPSVSTTKPNASSPSTIPSPAEDLLQQLQDVIAQQGGGRSTSSPIAMPSPSPDVSSGGSTVNRVSNATSGSAVSTLGSQVNYAVTVQVGLTRKTG